MAVYVITGGLGAGKSLMAMSKMRDALQKGLRVATNMDIRLEHLVGGKRIRYDVQRLPDYPQLEHFEAIGDGYHDDGQRFDEKRFGWIFLDEVATFLNSREWNMDPNDEGPKEGAQKRAVQKRMALIKWLRHCRKHRWHLVLVTQGLSSLDAQVRNELVEHEVQCRRMDRLTVPFVSSITKLLGIGAVRPPQVHVGIVYYHELSPPRKVETWYLPDASSLYPAYNTQQVLDGDCLGYSVLDGRHAPWLWPPRGLAARFQLAWPGLFRPSPELRRHQWFRLAEKAPPTYTQTRSFAEWDASERARRRGPLGEREALGEAAEPANEELLQDVAD